MDRPITTPPKLGSAAKFSQDFGIRSLLTVDTEEEFDWEKPFQKEGHGLGHVAKLARFQEFCEGLGVCPVYLIDWPIATSTEAQAVLAGPLAAGKAEVGIQLHPWVNPPFDEEVTAHNSYAGNLPHELERKKFLNLRDTICANFNVEPQIYRAGRYGLGTSTGEMLKEAGVAVDSSVRANFDYRAAGGRDYSGFPLEPYWVDDAKQLLELPLTTVYFGILRKQGRTLYPLLSKVPQLTGLASKLGLLERISLTPEGVTADEALRGIDIAIDDGLPLLVLSFHSPSIVPGNTPYVHNADDLDSLYDWWTRIYSYLDMRGVRPTTVKEVLNSVEK